MSQKSKTPDKLTKDIFQKEKYGSQRLQIKKKIKHKSIWQHFNAGHSMQSLTRTNRYLIHVMHWSSDIAPDKNRFSLTYLFRQPLPYHMAQHHAKKIFTKPLLININQLSLKTWTNFTFPISLPPLSPQISSLCNTHWTQVHGVELFNNADCPLSAFPPWQSTLVFRQSSALPPAVIQSRS